jgi:hypothetical protein
MIQQTTGKIKFYYKKDTLFNDISLMSNYMCKNMTSKDGNSLTDEYAISDDERDLVDVSVRATLPDIYEAMVKITNSIDSAFEDEDTISGETCVSFTIQDNEAYNGNVLTMVDASLYNCLKYGTLREVYSTITQTEFFNLCTARFLSELFKLKGRLFQLKKKSVVSSLT